MSREISTTEYMIAQRGRLRCSFGCRLLVIAWRKVVLWLVSPRSVLALIIGNDVMSISTRKF